MKFRMAPNSLFAVLLRSPFWISWAIALGLAGAAHAILPPEYRLVGSMSGLPFLVIGGIALWKQLRAPSARDVERLTAAAAAMTWPQFEAALREGFTRQGWAIEPDAGGADLMLRKDGRRALVSARRWKAARHGEEALQPLDAAMRRLDVSRGVYVALGELSPQAQRFAQDRQIEVVQGDALAVLLRR